MVLCAPIFHKDTNRTSTFHLHLPESLLSDQYNGAAHAGIYKHWNVHIPMDNGSQIKLGHNFFAFGYIFIYLFIYSR